MGFNLTSSMSSNLLIFIITVINSFYWSTQSPLYGLNGVHLTFAVFHVSKKKILFNDNKVRLEITFSI